MRAAAKPSPGRPPQPPSPPLYRLFAFPVPPHHLGPAVRILDFLRRLLGSTIRPPAPQPPPPVITSPAGNESAQLLAAVNAARVANGKPVFTPNAQLDGVAQELADHCSLNYGVDHWDYFGRLARAGFANHATAEDAAGTMSAAQAVEGWLESAPHRANMLGDYRLAGCGFSRLTEFAAYVLTVSD